ncbi:MAG TPA: hypothetical protein VIY52_07145 [Streptosporangiaceae bacterium]
MRRGLVLAAGWGLLCAVVAGCGSVVASTGAGGAASTPAGSAASPSGAAGGAAAGASASAEGAAGVQPGEPAVLVGCAGVDQATAVSVTRINRLVVPTFGGTLMVTDRKPAQVRALFRDFCNAVTHPDVPPMVMRCPADFGTDYFGVFYDGNRVLARYTYDATGCRRLAVIVGTITQSTLLAGRAASAAPHLLTDFAAVLTGAKPTVKPTTSNMNKGGGPA